MKFVLILATLLALASAQPSQPTSICQRYANALFGPITAGNNAAYAAAEQSLVSAIVVRAFNGVNATASVNGTAVAGIFNSTILLPFFTSPVNYTANSVARATLFNHFDVFFLKFLNCWDATSSNVLPSTMGTVHAGMNITAAVWNEFVGIFQNVFVSLGISESDRNYTAALFLQFGYGAGGVDQICNDAISCPPRAGVAGLAAGINGKNPMERAFVLELQPFDVNMPNVTIAVGDYVHWDSINDGVYQSSNDNPNFPYHTDAVPGGFSGPAPSYTFQFLVPGTYFYKSLNALHPSSLGRIIVNGTTSSTGGQSPAVSSSSTGPSSHTSAASVAATPAITLLEIATAAAWVIEYLTRPRN